MVETFIERFRRELEVWKAFEDGAKGPYGSYFSLLVCFNEGKYRNSECAWTMNTNNTWDRWRV